VHQFERFCDRWGRPFQERESSKIRKRRGVP